MKVIMFYLVMTALSCRAQTSTGAPTMKGHALGESVQQFMTESNDVTRGQMKVCSSGDSTEHNVIPYECKDFNQTVKTGDGSFRCDLPMYEIGICRDFRGEVTFANNKLVMLNLEVDKDWNESLIDAASKFGRPDETHTDTVQNAYGAKFDIHTATWTKSKYVVIASEKVNLPYNLQRFVEITLTDLTYFQSEQAQKQHGNALD